MYAKLSILYKDRRNGFSMDLLLSEAFNVIISNLDEKFAGKISFDVDFSSIGLDSIT